MTVDQVLGLTFVVIGFIAAYELIDLIVRNRRNRF